MAYNEDHVALAAEYALGTLDADERALVETMMIVDPGFMAMVEAWDLKLAPLHQMVASVEPPAHLWEGIKSAAGLGIVSIEPQFGDDGPFVADMPDDYEQRPAVSEAGPLTPAPASVPIGEGRRAGSTFGMAMAALAACMAALVTLQAYRPELLPDSLRVKPTVQLVEVPAPAPPQPAQLVAVLQHDAAVPAFIMTVDGATKNFTVRRVGAAPEPGKSFELWIVSDKLQRPRSLGVIGGSDFTMHAALTSYDAATIDGATYAVTLEPQGGSKSGRPTSNPIYAGKLVESVPGGAANR